jgi:hypothetical protein
MPSYTARELERESGIDRRTIAYYVQEGLLPRVGRRGRRTRYPQLFLDRLLFIQRVRQAEEEGAVPPVSLDELREVFERIAPEVIARVAAEEIAVTPELVSQPTTAFRIPEMEVDSMMPDDLVMGTPEPRSFLRARARLDRMESPSDEMPSLRDASPRYHASPSLEMMLTELEEIGRRQSECEDGPVEVWSRVRISPNIELSVRGLTEEQQPLLSMVQRVMRRMAGLAGRTRHSNPEWRGDADE